MTKELIKRFPEKLFVTIDSYSLLYEQNNRVFENMVLFLGCKVYCLTFLYILSDGDLNLVLACDINVYKKGMTEDLGFVTIKFT